MADRIKSARCALGKDILCGMSALIIGPSLQPIARLECETVDEVKKITPLRRDTS